MGLTVVGGAALGRVSNNDVVVVGGGGDGDGVIAPPHSTYGVIGPYVSLLSSSTVLPLSNSRLSASAASNAAAYCSSSSGFRYANAGYKASLNLAASSLFIYGRGVRKCRVEEG